MNWKILLVMVVALALVATSALAITCYQEDSSIPNQTGIDTPNCGLNYSGSIVYFAEPTINPLTGVINDTWIKPSHARDTSQFKFQVSINGNQTTSIPLDCYYYDPTAIHYQLRTQLTFGQGGAVDVLCFNGTGYSVLFHTTCVGNGLPGFGSPTLAYDGNWSTYVWYESYPVSNWMTYPNYPTNPETGCAIWDSAMDWDVCIPAWNCSGYGACVGGHRACNAVADANYCGETYTGNYSEFSPPFCPTGYASQYGAGDLASMIPDLLGNAFFMVLTLTGVIVIVTFVVWGTKKIRGEIK